MSIENASILLRPVRLGLLLSTLTILFGFGLGIAFGLKEDAIKDNIKARAEAAMDTAYVTADGSFDQAKFKAVTAKSWIYIKRAHLHANGIGTAALVMCLLLSLATRTRPTFRGIAAFSPGHRRPQLRRLLALRRPQSPNPGQHTRSQGSISLASHPHLRRSRSRRSPDPPVPPAQRLLPVHQG